MNSASRPPIHPAEVATLCVMAAAVLGACVSASQTRLLWLDEILTALLVTDSTIGGMLAALNDEINAMPPLYFVAGWNWVRVFGSGELALRLPSAVATCLALICIWDGLRGFANRWVATAYAIAIPLSCWQVRCALVAARPYGWYFAAYALAFALYVRCAEQPVPTRRWSIAVTVAHAALVALHYVGALFSALLVTAALVVGWLEGDPRFRRYAVCAAVGWLAAIPSVPFYLTQRNLAGEASWLDRPSWHQLNESFTCGIDGFPWMVTGLLCAWLLVASLRGTETAGRSYITFRPGLRPVAVLSALTLLLLPVVWIESQWGARVFLLRYLFPAIICWTCLVGWAAGWLFDQCGRRDAQAPAGIYKGAAAYRRAGRWRGIMTALAVGLVGLPFASASTRFWLDFAVRRSGTDSQRLQMCLNVIGSEPDSQVLTTNTRDLVEIAYYLRQRRDGAERVKLVLESGEDEPSSDRSSALALQRHYFPDCLTTLDQFLEVTPRFLVVDKDSLISQRMVERREWVGRKLTGAIWLWERDKRS